MCEKCEDVAELGCRIVEQYNKCVPDDCIPEDGKHPGLALADQPPSVLVAIGVMVAVHVAISSQRRGLVDLLKMYDFPAEATDSLLATLFGPALVGLSARLKVNPRLN